MGEVSKTMQVVTGKNLRVIVNYVNEKKIQKESIVAILQDGEGYQLVYYK